MRLAITLFHDEREIEPEIIDVKMGCVPDYIRLGRLLMFLFFIHNPVDIALYRVKERGVKADGKEKE